MRDDARERLVRRSRARGRCGFCSRRGPRVSGSRRRWRPPATRWWWRIRITRRCTATLRRKVKTDRRDVAALAEANRRGWYRRGPSDVGARNARRGRCCAPAGSWCRCERDDGVAAIAAATGRAIACRRERPSGSRRAWRSWRCRRGLATTVAPLRADDRDADDGDRRPSMSGSGARRGAIRSSQGLQTVPGVGPVVALTFRAHVDDVGRFTRAARSVRRSAWCRAKTVRPNAGTAGTSPKRARASCAACWCRRPGRVGGVKASGDACARGSSAWRRAAAVASRSWRLARRLSRILYALWRDRSTFDVKKLAAA